MPKYEGSSGGGSSYNKRTGEVRTAAQNKFRREANKSRKAAKAARKAGFDSPSAR